MDHHQCYRNAAAILMTVPSSVGNVAAGELLLSVAAEWRMLGAYVESVKD